MSTSIETFVVCKVDTSQEMIVPELKIQRAHFEWPSLTSQTLALPWEKDLKIPKCTFRGNDRLQGLLTCSTIRPCFPGRTTFIHHRRVLLVFDCATWVIFTLPGAGVAKQNWQDIDRPFISLFTFKPTVL